MLSARQALASHCDGSLAARLEGNCALAASHVTDAITSVSDDVAQCVPAFAASARAHGEAVDKRLAMKAEELRDTIELLKAYVQQLSVGEQSSAMFEHSVAAMKWLLELTDDLPDISLVVSSDGIGPVAEAVSEATHAVAELDSDDEVSWKADTRWFPRGSTRTFTVPLLDENENPVYGVMLSDVACTIQSEGGWEIVSVSLESNVLSVSVALTVDCSRFACVDVDILGATLTAELEVCSKHLS